MKILKATISLTIVLFTGVSAYADGNLELLTTITIERPNTKIISVIPVDDFNNDGYDDLLVGVIESYPYPNYYEAAYLYYGGPTFDAEPNLIFEETQDTTLCYAQEERVSAFGGSATGLNDFNGDGYNDLAIGASQYCANGYRNGRIFIYYGSLSPNTVVDLTIDGELDFDGLGWKLVNGDFNGDNIDDIYTFTGDPWNGQKLYLYLGDNPPDNQYDWIQNYSNTDNMILYINGGYDFNNDGYDDYNWDNSAMYPPYNIFYLGNDPLNQAPHDSCNYYIYTSPGDVSLDGIDDLLVYDGNEVLLALGGLSPDYEPDYHVTRYSAGGFIYSMGTNNNFLISHRNSVNLMRVELYCLGVPTDTLNRMIFNYPNGLYPYFIDIDDLNADDIDEIAFYAPDDTLRNEIYLYSIFPVGIEDEEELIPLGTDILLAYPNPFNSSCKITVSDLDISHISIYDITGGLVETVNLYSGQADWDATRYSSGIYFAKATNENHSQSVKLIYLK